MPNADRHILTSPVWGTLIVVLLLTGFVVMLDHVAHCDHTAGHCILCSVFGAVMIVAVVGLVVFCPPERWGRPFPVLAAVQSTGLSHRPVRAPPSILP